MNPKTTTHLLLLLAFFARSFPGNAQHSDLRQIKTYYQQQQEDTCVVLFHDPPNSIDQIVLIRHGQPNLQRKGWYNRKEAEAYIRAYDSVQVIPFNFVPISAESLATDTIYCSNIPRAVSTAHLIFDEEYIIVEDPRFREFERKVMRFCNMKLPLGFWLTTSRLLWMVGLNDKGIENFKEAKHRAKENADLLIQQARADNMTIVVAHGLHNRYVMKYLKKRGWKTVRKGGNDYGAVTVMASDRVSE